LRSAPGHVDVAAGQHRLEFSVSVLHRPRGGSVSPAESPNATAVITNVIGSTPGSSWAARPRSEDDRRAPAVPEFTPSSPCRDGARPIQGGHVTSRHHEAGPVDAPLGEPRRGLAACHSLTSAGFHTDERPKTRAGAGAWPRAT
jgi:hypothetical protein